MSLSPHRETQPTVQKSARELWEIFKLWFFLSSKSINNVCKVLPSPEPLGYTHKWKFLASSLISKPERSPILATPLNCKRNSTEKSKRTGLDSWSSSETSYEVCTPSGELRVWATVLGINIIALAVNHQRW